MLQLLICTMTLLRGQSQRQRKVIGKDWAALDQFGSIATAQAADDVYLLSSGAIVPWFAMPCLLATGMAAAEKQPASAERSDCGPRCLGVHRRSTECHRPRYVHAVTDEYFSLLYILRGAIYITTSCADYAGRRVFDGRQALDINGITICWPASI
eukprot:scaffold13825_cov16-Prasinocladus_malaysianus.AAC.1